MFSLDNIPEASRWLEGGVEMVALFPPLPAALTPEQKTELMHEMLRLVLGPLMRASSVESQCEAVMAVTPPSLLRHPDPSAYFGTVSQYAAWEHQAMMQIVPLVAHLPGHEDIARVVILFNEWYRAYFRVAYHTEASLQDATRKTIVQPQVLIPLHQTPLPLMPFPPPRWTFMQVTLLLRTLLPLRPPHIMPQPYLLRSITPLQHLLLPANAHAPHATAPHCHTSYALLYDAAQAGRGAEARLPQAVVAVAAAEVAVNSCGHVPFSVTLFSIPPIGEWAQAVKHNTSVLTRRSRRMAVGDAQDPVWAEYGAALGSAVMDGIARVMQRVGITASGVQVMPRWHEWVEGGLTGHGISGVQGGHMVKAAPGEGKFSYVSIDGAEGEWYARCLMLFHFMDDEAQIHRRAVVRYFDEHPTPCPVTGCMRLLPTEGEDEYVVVEVESILSLAHIVPCFTEARFSLVNRFLFDE
ncbi:unnamed protein product [Closterium sp. Naga37s-1]|nr:unnamed protein product [Closterium sp. Naga37s-1]